MAGLGPQTFSREASRKDRDKALAVAIVHETIFHGIYRHWLPTPEDAHFHDEGYIDSADLKVGGNLSDEAAKLLIEMLKAD